MTAFSFTDSYLLRVLTAAVLMATICGPMGCFVVWRNLAYFGAAISHAALLGVSLGLLLEIGDAAGLLLIALAAAAILALAERRRSLPADAVLGVFAHGSLALGLVLAAVADPVRLDLMGYLFGDVLAVSAAEVGWIAAGAAFAAVLLRTIWPALLSATVAEEVARAEGVATHRARLIYLFLLAAVIAFAAKVVGLLLVTAMLIIPAAAARPFARSPEGMAALAAGLGALAAFLGLAASLQWDLPAGPAMATASFLIFAVLMAMRLAANIRRG